MIKDRAGRPVPHEYPHLWELEDSTGRPVRFGARWLRKATIPKAAAPGPYSAWPGTMVVAEIAHPQDTQRLVYFVHLSDWGFPRQHFRESLVVDAESLGPQYRRGRKISRQDRRAFRAARRAAREHWRALNSNCATVEPSWLDRILRRPLTSVWRVVLESETQIVHLGTPQNPVAFTEHPQYARESLYRPVAPNIITPDALGPGKVVIAYAEVSAGYQSVMRMPYWAQRVWYVDLTLGDEKTYMDGLSQPIGRVVDFLAVRPGLISRAFDVTRLRPIDDLPHWLTRKRQLLEQYGAPDAQSQNL